MLISSNHNLIGAKAKETNINNIDRLTKFWIGKFEGLEFGKQLPNSDAFLSIIHSSHFCLVLQGFPGTREVPGTVYPTHPSYL